VEKLGVEPRFASKSTYFFFAWWDSNPWLVLCPPPFSLSEHAPYTSATQFSIVRLPIPPLLRLTVCSGLPLLILQLPVFPSLKETYPAYVILLCGNSAKTGNKEIWLQLQCRPGGIILIVLGLSVHLQCLCRPESLFLGIHSPNSNERSQF